jgi:hypothetical protein
LRFGWRSTSDQAGAPCRSPRSAWDTGTPLRELLAERDLGLDLDAVFDLGAYTRHAHESVGRLGPRHD